MEQTEKYLNNIISKRLGSVVNQSAYSQNPNTVARVPLQEETVDKMPTVFRKKYETVLVQQQSIARESQVAQIVAAQTEVTEKQPVQSHRVEYMTISKRISMKKNDDLISPTVNIDKYQTKLEKRNSSSVPLPTEEDVKAENQPQSQTIRKSEGIINSPPRIRRRKIFS